MKDLLILLTKSIVDLPEEVSISEVEGEKAVVYEIKVAESDVGKVIGKHGRIINAIRTIVRAAAVKEGKKVSIELIG
ncbi:MAG TPA: KH domain-containing protein [bacterium]|nr:KH domain-containing protein [bacterium]